LLSKQQITVLTKICGSFLINNTADSSESKGLLVALKSQAAVTFSSKVKVCKTLDITEYSDDEIRACWFDKTEFKSIRKDARLTARLIAEGQLQEDNEIHTLRGLEF
jgi:hypothetical protein